MAADPSLPVVLLKQARPVLRDPAERQSSVPRSPSPERKAGSPGTELPVGRGHALDAVAIELKDLLFLREVHLGIPHVSALRNRQLQIIFMIVLTAVENRVTIQSKGAVKIILP